MKKIQSFVVCFLLTWFWFSAPAQNNLSAYEYWFNNSYDNRQTFSINSAEEHYFIENIDVSALPDGVNVLNIRHKDQNNLYSSTLSKIFYKPPVNQELSKNLTGYEIWFNNDYENKQTHSVSASTGHHLLTEVDVSALPDGVNVLNIRYKNENNLYSSTLSKMFYKPPINHEFSKNLIGYEMWFNNDYENRQANSISASTGHHLLTEVDVSALPDGVNVLNIRYKNENNLYSSILSKMFYKKEQNYTGENAVTAYKYWFDDNYENAVFVQLQSPAKQISVLENLDVSHLTMGEHTINFQFQDESELWSVVSTDNFTKTALPTAAFSIVDNVACVNGPVQFVNESIDADTWLWDFGDGTTSTEFEPEHVFFETGDFEVSLTATDSESGSESTVSHTFTIHPDYETEESVEICEGEVYTWNGNDYSSSGRYSKTLSSVNGCDSIVTLDLAVNPVYNVMYSGEDAVPDYLVNETFEETPLNTFPDDWIIRYAGTGANDHFVIDAPVKNGNHSLKVSGSGWAANLSKAIENIPDKVVLEGWIRAENVASGGRCGLGIGNPDVGSWGAYWGRVEFYNGNLITFYYTGNSGGYGTQYVLQPASSDTWYHVKIETDAAAGTYKVYINGNQASSETGGQTTTEFPLYTSIQATSVEIYGNSLIYFDDIRMYESDNTPVIICTSETPYIFGDQELTESGTYTETFQTIHGCDSLVTLNLTVNPVYNHTETASICEGDSYSFGGTAYTESGEYAHTFTSVNGCDSIVTLTLIVNPVYDEAVEVSIHEDELPYTFGGENLTEDGIYTKTFASVGGCDSTVTLSLTIQEYSVPVAVCNPITIYLNEAGNYSLSVADLENIAAGSSDAHSAFADLTVSVTPEAFTCSDAGNDVDVMVIVANEDNYYDTCYTTVSVADNIAPQVDCRDLEVYLDKNGEAFIDVNEIYADARDACGIKEITTYKEVFTCDDLGYNYFWVFVTDFNQNKSTCQNIVAVFDTINPDFKPVDEIKVAAPEGECKATIDYPEILVSDNCETEDMFLYRGLGPEGEFPLGTTVEQWVAVDSSGNSDTLSFEVTVLKNPANPSVDPVVSVEIPEDSGWFTIQLTGVYDGSDCEDYALDFLLMPANENLLESYTVMHAAGENTATLKALPALNAHGSSEATLTVVNSETGKEFSIGFSLSILPENDAPFTVQPVGNLEMYAGDILKVFFDPEKEVIFDDVDEDDILQLSLVHANEEILPEWLMFRNDSLIATPSAADTGCIELVLVATDLSGEEAFSPFTLCAGFPVGINLPENPEVKVYPNPTPGIVYIDFSAVSGNEIDVSIMDILGKEVLRKKYPAEGHIEVDLSDKVSGIYFLKLKTDDGVELNRKIIVSKEK